MKKRLLSLLLCSAMVIVMMTGCGGAANSGTDEPDTTEAASATETVAEGAGQKITFMAPDWAIPTDEQLDAFTAKTGIEVEVSEVGWDDIRTKIATAAAGGESVADVVEVDWSWVGEFAAADWLEPIALSDADKEDFLTLDTFSIDGNVLALPYANDYRLAYYNKEQFKAAGVEEPQTYDDVLAACEALQKSGVEHPLALPLNAEEKAATNVMWTAYQMNGVVWNEDGTFNEDSVMDALNYIQTAVEKGYTAPEDKTSSGKEAYLRVCAGTASFLVGPTFMVGKCQNPDASVVVDQVEPVLSPGKDGKASVTMALPEAIGIMKTSENKEAAKAFVEWYTSDEMQKEFQASLGNLPTRRSTLNALVEDGIISNAGAMVEQAELIASPFPNGVPAYYAEMSNAMANAVNKMALGELDAAGAYAQMAAALEALLEE